MKKTIKKQRCNKCLIVKEIDEFKLDINNDCTAIEPIKRCKSCCSFFISNEYGIKTGNSTDKTIEEIVLTDEEKYYFIKKYIKMVDIRIGYNYNLISFYSEDNQDIGFSFMNTYDVRNFLYSQKVVIL